MTDIEAYQKLLIILTSATPIDYKSVLLKIAQLHPVAVVEAIESPNPVASMVVNNDNDEECILRSWRGRESVIQAIKDLRTLRSDRARQMGIDPVTQSGMAQCRIGLKACKDDVENTLIKHNLWTPPVRTY